MSVVTYEQMAMAALKYREIPVTNNNVRALVIWSCSAAHHPVNGPDRITKKYDWDPWDTECIDYESIEAGIEAFWRRLDKTTFAPIKHALINSSPPATTCEFIMSSGWGSLTTSGLVAQVLSNWKVYATMYVAGSIIPDVNNPTKVSQTAVEILPLMPAVPELNVQASRLRGIANEIESLGWTITSGALRTMANDMELIANG